MTYHTQKAPRWSGWIDRLAEGRLGITILSALEATILPIPLEAVLIPLMVARPRAAIGIGVWALVGCVIGSAALYLAGWLLADPVVMPLLDWLGLSADFEAVQSRLRGGDLFVTVFLLSVSPFPIQLATVGSGMIGASPVMLLAGVAASRGVRYIGLGLLARWLGPRLQDIHVPKWVWAVGGVLVLVLLWLVLR